MARVRSAVTLGQKEFRLPSRYQHLFLRPPHFRSYLTEDLEANAIGEFDLATGRQVGVYARPCIATGSPRLNADSRPARNAPGVVLGMFDTTVMLLEIER